MMKLAERVAKKTRASFRIERQIPARFFVGSDCHRAWSQSRFVGRKLDCGRAIGSLCAASDIGRYVEYSRLWLEVHDMGPWTLILLMSRFWGHRLPGIDRRHAPRNQNAPERAR